VSEEVEEHGGWFMMGIVEGMLRANVVEFWLGSNRGGLWWRGQHGSRL